MLDVSCCEFIHWFWFIEIHLNSKALQGRGEYFHGRCLYLGFCLAVSCASFSISEACVHLTLTFVESELWLKKKCAKSSWFRCVFSPVSIYTHTHTHTHTHFTSSFDILHAHRDIQRYNQWWHNSHTNTQTLKASCMCKHTHTRSHSLTHTHTPAGNSESSGNLCHGLQTIRNWLTFSTLNTTQPVSASFTFSLLYYLFLPPPTAISHPQPTEAMASQHMRETIGWESCVCVCVCVCTDDDD